MTKIYKASRREYQRSPVGAPDGVISNATALTRIPATGTTTTGEFVVTDETTRKQLKDTTYNAFSAATHEGRLVTFPMATGATPPSGGTAGTRLHNGWTFRIKTVISTSIIELEGFRAEYAGTGINYVIHAAADFTAASGAFPADTGPTGANTDTVERSNTGPCEYQGLAFPSASDGRLSVYPMMISRRTSGTVLRISDPFDNIQTFPEPTGLQWFLRDFPAYTIPQFFKIAYRVALQVGYTLEQHRGKNNGVGAGGNAQNLVNNVEDMILKTTGEDGNQVSYVRSILNHTNGNNDGTSSQGDVGMDYAMFSKWDRTYPSVAIPGTTTTTNQGNGINALAGAPLDSASANDGYAAQADALNNGSAKPYFSSGNLAPVMPNVRWSHPFDPDTPRTISNTLNTPEGGEIQEISYTMFGDKDEMHIILEAPGAGSAHLTFGLLKHRPDAQSAMWKTNFSAVAGANALLRIGGPGTANGNNPATTTIPHQVGDRIQSVGQKVNLSPLIIPTSGTAAHAGEFIDSSTISALPGLVQAIAILICDTVANITDGSKFTLDDGLGNPLSSRVYEWNKTGGITGDIAIDLITGSPTTADQNRDRIRDAINPLVVANFTWNGTTTVTTPDTSEVVVDDWIWLTTSNANQLFRIASIVANTSVTIANPDSFTIPSGSGANTTRRAKHAFKALATVSARVDLTHGRKGGVGNVPLIDTNSEFLAGTEGPGGGGYAIEVLSLFSALAAGALVGEDPQPMFFFRPNNIATPFSSTGGTQGIFRVSNRAGFADATYRDASTPRAGSFPTAMGFDALAETAGMFGADTREGNPNERSGRFTFYTLSVRDTVGGQIRGSMRYLKIGSPRVGAYGLRKDRQGQYHLIMPFQGRAALSTETTSNELVIALGPMSPAMAVLS